MAAPDSTLPLRLLLAGLAVLLWSAIHPHDYFTWFLEVAPALIGGVILLATFHRFRFTDLVYVADLHPRRHPHDRRPLHLRRGAAGQLAARRPAPVPQSLRSAGPPRPGLRPRDDRPRTPPADLPAAPGKWLSTIIVSICLAISATYELFEWAVAAATGQAADAFLGTQGDPWDTQWDMFMCLCGAILSLLLLARLHNRQLSRLCDHQHP